jgi:hypothetical protein
MPSILESYLVWARRVLDWLYFLLQPGCLHTKSLLPVWVLYMSQYDVPAGVAPLQQCTILPQEKGKGGPTHDMCLSTFASRETILGQTVQKKDLLGAGLTVRPLRPATTRLCQSELRRQMNPIV